jgi:dTDP-4-amino-4,6-dideoxygalactose transaminase
MEQSVKEPNLELDRLAIDGGVPVRTVPLPWELPGAHWIGDEELTLVTRVLQARSPFRFYGPDLQHMTDALEAAWHEKFGVSHALAVSSGSAALYIGLAALEVGPGDEVLVPGYMWTSCLSAIIRLGAIPRLVDIDDTFCMDPADLRRKIGPHSRAILYVHMNGASGRIGEVARTARDAGLSMLEDCAQAIGATAEGRSIGTFGDIAVFSFQLNKHITAGEGGLVACRTKELHNRCVALHDVGYVRSADGRLDPFNERYQLWGVGSRMSELTAAMLVAQLGKLDRIIAEMRRAKRVIRSRLDELPGFGFRTIVDSDGDCGSFIITIHRSAQACRRFNEALRGEGIRGPEGSLACATLEEWGLHWYFNNTSLVRKRPMSHDGFPWSHPSNAFAKDYAYERGALPCCDDLCARSAILAVASSLSEGDVNDIVDAFRKVAAALPDL